MKFVSLLSIILLIFSCTDVPQKFTDEQIQSFWKDEIDDEDDDPFVDTMFLRKSGRGRDLEEVLEDNTLDFLIIVADFIMRYLPLTNELLF